MDKFEWSARTCAKVAEQTHAVVLGGGQPSVIRGKAGEKLREGFRETLNRGIPIGVQLNKLCWAGSLKITELSIGVEPGIVFAFVVEEVWVEGGIRADDLPFRKCVGCIH